MSPFWGLSPSLANGATIGGGTGNVLDAGLTEMGLGSASRALFGGLNGGVSEGDASSLLQWHS